MYGLGTYDVIYRYGVEAGQLTDDSLATAGHVADITGVSCLGNVVYN